MYRLLIVSQYKKSVNVSMDINVTVSATSANLGPGFDCLGVALACYNEFRFASATHLEIRSLTGTPLDTTAENLAYRSFAHLFTVLGQPIPPVRLGIRAVVPLARGLGSSATAIVGGLVAANEWLGQPWDRAELLAAATALEGHPDNVAPALLGGCQLSLVAGEVVCAAVPWPETVVPVVVVPDFQLSTQAARAVLPRVVSRGDALFNSTRVGLLVLALSQGRTDWLELALQDRLHEPYRQKLVPGLVELAQVAQSQGAYGLVLSGAGPTVLALCAPVLAQQVGGALVEAWAGFGVRAEAHFWEVDRVGVRVYKGEE